MGFGRCWWLSFCVALAVSVSGCGEFKKKQQTEKARNTCNELRFAVKNFRTEYNHFPSGAGEQPAEVAGTLLGALTGDDKAANPRLIPFLSRAGQTTLPDPWGHPYRILVDADQDGKLTLPGAAGAGAVVADEVVVFSAGPDGTPDTWADNVR